MTTFDERLADASYAAGAEDVRLRIGQDLASLLDATRHDDLGPEMDAVRARLETWLHTATLPNRKD